MKKKNSKARYDKKDFLFLLATSTPQELNKVIEEKGKKAKFQPFIIYNN